jgi:putative transposase
LLTEIRQVVADQPTYGYGRVYAPIRRHREEQGGTAINVKRVYRVMRVHGILPKATGGPSETPNGLSQRDN